jgi:hypothetical protein
MKNVTLISRNFTFLFIIAILTATTSVSFPGVSVHKDSLNKEANDYLSFYEEEDGETVHWEANFDDGEIVSIYKNGEKISDDEISDYKWKINCQLDEMRFGSEEFSFRMPEFDFDMEQFNEDMERFRENMKENWELHDNFGFDEDKFREEMEEFHKNLKKLHPGGFYVPFDSEKFKERMDKLEKRLRKFHLDRDSLRFDFDWDCEKENDDEV